MWKVISLLFLILSDGTFSNVKNGVPGRFTVAPEELSSRRSLSVGEYLIKIKSVDQNNFDAYVSFERDGKIIYRMVESGTHYYFGSDFGERKKPDISQTILPLTGTKSLNLVISEWTGGAHAAYLLHIFELEPSFHKVASINGENFEPSFKDMDRDGIPEIITYDNIFAYTFSSFAMSVFPKVILKYENGSYVVAKQLMYKSSPSKSSIRKDARKLKAHFREIDTSEDVPQKFMKKLTDLIYSGHEDLAFKWIDWSWPDSPREKVKKAKFLKEFQEQINKSEYYAQLKKKGS